MEDRRAAGVQALAKAANALIAAGEKPGGLTGFFTTFRPQVPQIYLNIDRDKVEALDVPIASVFQTLQANLGSYYVNDFNFLGRTYQVNLQAQPPFRVRPDQIRNLYTRNNSGGMVPLGTLIDVQEINAPDKIMHYNLYPSADINGETLPGVSSGEAIEKMEEAAKDTLSDQFGFEWTELIAAGKARGQHRAVHFPVVRAVRVPGARRAVRKLEPAAGDHPDRADVPALGAGGHLPAQSRQQHFHADRLRRAGGSGVQERDPDRGVRPAARSRRARTATRRRWRPRGCGCGPF